VSEKNDFEIEVDLKDILNILKKGLPVLILIPLLFMVIAGYVSLYRLDPVYRASTTLMVGGNIYANDDKQYIHYEDLLTGKQLVSTYSEIAKSRSVCEQVTIKNDLDITAENFSKKITVQAINDTPLISLNITDTNPAAAAKLANETATVFMEKVKEIMQFNNVKIIDIARTPKKPIGPNVNRNIVLAGVLGLFMAIFIIFLRQFFKQTFENSEEAAKLLETTVLANIPVIKESKSNSGGVKNAES